MLNLNKSFIDAGWCIARRNFRLIRNMSMPLLIIITVGQLLKLMFCVKPVQFRHPKLFRFIIYGQSIISCLQFSRVWSRIAGESGNGRIAFIWYFKGYVSLQHEDLQDQILLFSSIRISHPLENAFYIRTLEVWWNFPLDSLIASYTRHKTKSFELKKNVS